MTSDDFGISGRVPEPRKHYVYLWRPQDTLKNKRKPNHLEHLILGNPKLWSVGNDRRRQIMNIRLKNSCKSCKSWIWDQHLPENMKWQFGKSLKLWHQETNNLWHQETKKLTTKKPLSQETKKPRNNNSEKPRNQESTTLDDSYFRKHFLNIRLFASWNMVHTLCDFHNYRMRFVFLFLFETFSKNLICFIFDPMSFLKILDTRKLPEMPRLTLWVASMQPGISSHIWDAA